MKFYITFGFAHKDIQGRSLANCYTIIEAPTEDKAREIMFASPLGKQWAFIYKDAIEPGVLKYKLIYVPFSQLMCKHENTLDVGDEDSIAVMCTDCEKLLSNDFFGTQK